MASSKHPVKRRGNNEAAKGQTSLFAARFSAGPIPDASSFESYERILPGSAERILKMAEEQAGHRHCLEKKISAAECRDSLLGIIFAFIIAITAIGGSVYAITMGAELGGGILGVGTIGGLVGVFIYGTRRNKKK